VKARLLVAGQFGFRLPCCEGSEKQQPDLTDYGPKPYKNVSRETFLSDQARKLYKVTYVRPLERSKNAQENSLGQGQKIMVPGNLSSETWSTILCLGRFGLSHDHDRHSGIGDNEVVPLYKLKNLPRCRVVGYDPLLNPVHDDADQCAENCQPAS
jgi:hypothetical protein